MDAPEASRLVIREDSMVRSLLTDLPLAIQVVSDLPPPGRVQNMEDSFLSRYNYARAKKKF